MLKSTAGGGGIGMRVCRSAGRTERGLRSGQAPGQNNFSDAGVFIEKYIQRARHLEVQVFGDGRGEVIASACATARCSGATRKSSRKPRRRTCPRHGR
jgi:urea carboxylase